MRNSSDRPSMFEYDWWHPLTWIAGISFLATLISFGLLIWQPGSTSLAFLSSILTLIASSLISHLVTYSNERRQFSRHLAKFAAFAKRRVDILCTDLNLLSLEIADTADLTGAKRTVLYALKNLEQDAKASVQDIDDMRKIDEEETGQAFEPATSSTEEKVAYSCLSCGYSNTAQLRTGLGVTKHVECANCRARMLLHRINTKGAIRVVKPATKTLELQAAVAAKSPTRSAQSAVLANESRTQDSFLCPRCQHRIRFSATADQEEIEKPCFSCLSVVKYNRRTRHATVLTERKPTYVETLNDGSDTTCSTCNKDFVSRIFRTEDGKQLVCCFACNTIYLPVVYKKKIIEKTCPTEGCGNTISFKADDNMSESKQFCFECMNRLVYRCSTDEVEVFEKLNVLQVSYADFDANGRLCPHCNRPSSGRFSMNSKHQKISICWGCKNVFELLGSSAVIPIRRTENR